MSKSNVIEDPNRVDVSHLLLWADQGMQAHQWGVMTDLTPRKWNEAHTIVMAMIEDDESKRDAVCAGKNLGKIEEGGYIKSLFAKTKDDPTERAVLIRMLEDGIIPEGYTQTNDGPITLYEYADMIPDGPMD